jgi:hypothetical protein
MTTLYVAQNHFAIYFHPKQFQTLEIQQILINVVNVLDLCINIKIKINIKASNFHLSYFLLLSRTLCIIKLLCTK